MTSSTLLTDVAVGLAAGWVGARTKATAESLLQPWAEQLLPPEAGREELAGADPAGHGDRMPPTLLYRRLLRVAGRTREQVDAMDDETIEAGAVWLHRLMAYGYPVAYAVLSRRAPFVRAGGGTLAGAALFGAFHGAALPALGVQAAPAELPRAWWLWEGGSHVAYGAAVDLAVDVLRRFTR